MIRLIASDMDGTLLDEKMSISQANITAIKAAQSKGIKFMVATGRGYYEAKPALEEAGIECGMIAVNGAQIINAAGEVQTSVRIDSRQAEKIMAILKQLNIYFEIATNKGVYSDNQAMRLEKSAEMLATKIPHLTFKMAIAMASVHLDMLHIIYIDDFKELLLNDEIDILKIIAFDEDGHDILTPARKQIEKIKDLAVTSSFVNNIEINHIDAQKGIAVAHVADKLGIPLSQVMTIGDNFNDISMLEMADVSFAMENAEAQVKKVAKFQTTTNLKNGVGKAILRAIADDL